jgi:hypothetical protein
MVCSVSNLCQWNCELSVVNVPVLFIFPTISPFICHFLTRVIFHSKKLLFASTTSGKMMRRVPCEVCGYVMRIIKDPHDLVSSNIHVCSQCGEKNVCLRWNTNILRMSILCMSPKSHMLYVCYLTTNLLSPIYIVFSLPVLCVCVHY